MTTTTRALPERFRKVRNIEEGYQLHAGCPEHQDGHWVTVTSALHMLSPVKVSSFTLDVPVCIADCRRMSDHPDDELWSRRPAAGLNAATQVSA